MSASTSLVAPALVALALAATSSLAAAQDSTVRYRAGNVEVIHHRTPPATSVIAVRLYLLGGVRQVSRATAGTESFLLRASEYGTERYAGAAARRALAETGGSIGVEATPDWTVFSLQGVKQEFDSMWAVFADRLMHPTLDTVALRRVRSRMVERATARTSSPESQAWVMAESLAYRDHPYAVPPDGTRESLERISAADLRRFARDQLVTSRMLLVVVGDVAPAQVAAAVEATLGRLPVGTYVWTPPPPLRLAKPALAVAARQGVTNYIVGYMSGPSRSSPDYPAFRRAMDLLGAFISYEVRERNALSYAASVSMVDHAAPGAAIFLSTTRPDSTMRLVNRLIERMEDDLRIPRSYLRQATESHRSQFVYATEFASSHAAMLAEAQLYSGDHRMASRFAELLGAVDSPSLRRALRTYAKHIQYAYVGDEGAIDRALFMKR